MANYPFDKERSLLKTDESTRITMLLLNVFLIVTAVALAISFYILANLEINEEPVVSDIIIVPEGAPERGIKASELLEQGYSESGKIIVSPLLVDAELLHLQPYGELGMMDDDISRGLPGDQHLDQCRLQHRVDGGERLRHCDRCFERLPYEPGQIQLRESGEREGLDVHLRFRRWSVRFALDRNPARQAIGSV